MCINLVQVIQTKAAPYLTSTRADFWKHFSPVTTVAQFCPRQQRNKCSISCQLTPGLIYAKFFWVWHFKIGFALGFYSSAHTEKSAALKREERFFFHVNFYNDQSKNKLSLLCYSTLPKLYGKPEKLSFEPMVSMLKTTSIMPKYHEMTQVVSK